MKNEWNAQFPDDRPEVPCGVEDASEAAWADYDECCAAIDGRVARIRQQQSERQMRQVLRRASQARANERFLAAELQAPGVPAPSIPRETTAESVMRFAREQGRICPLPRAWRQLFLQLPVARVGDTVRRAPLPLDSIEWPLATDFVRQQRLREQLDWAERHGAIAKAQAFLAGLAESEWHRLGALEWPTLTA